MSRAQDADFARDVFVSYASDDRARVLPIVSWLESRGWTVWWDRTIPPGQRWDETIERALNAARCVLVVWSRSSRASDWVKTEAAVAARRNALVPVRIDDVEVPLEFSRIQALDLIDWRGEPDTRELQLLEQTIAGALGRPPAPMPPPVRPRRSRRLIVAATAVVLLAVGGWWLVYTFIRPSHSGAEMASAAAVLLDEVDRKDNDSGQTWPDKLEDGSRTLLEEATLLGVEAARRGAKAEAQTVLRRSLRLLVRPVRTFGHDAEVYVIALSPDGARVAVGARDGFVAVWDFATGRLLTQFLAHRGGVQHIAFSRDGRTLASAGWDRTVRVSEPATGQELARLPHEDVVRWVVFSPDGARLASLADETAHLWSVANWSELHRLKHARAVDRGVFVADGKLLVTAPSHSADMDTRASIWDVSSGQLVRQLGDAEARVYGIAAGADVLATGSRHGIRLWRSSDWQPFGDIEYRSPLDSVAVTADGKFVVGGQSSARYGAVTVNPVASGASKSKVIAQRRNQGIYRIVLSNDGRLLAAIGQDQAVQVLELPGGKELLRAPTYEGAHNAPAPIALTPDGKYLVAAAPGGARLWEIRPADLVSEACVRVGRNLTPEEWHRFVPGERYRSTCIR